MKKYELALRDIEFSYRRDCSFANRVRCFALLDGVTILATHDNRINFMDYLTMKDNLAHFLSTWSTL